MSPSPQLAPPGSSTYNSDTMHVGDGTWDAGRDDFLLPNLQGLNFATMRYNGMGNRFFSMTGYQGLVKAHGILAAITFLLLVPAAIFVMRFHGRNPPQAVRFHIWLQITTLLLVTVVFALGWFQVGPERSLTNPHHGIGTAIYVLIWVQVIGGTAMHRIERIRKRYHVPLKAMLHHWLGRAIALLGIAQIALGLTLYGSPLFLFVLYALWVFGLLVAYFVLEWLHQRRKAQYAPQAGQSEYSEEIIQEKPDRSHAGFGKVAAATAAGIGLASLWRRKKEPRRRHSDGDLTSYNSSLSSAYHPQKVNRPVGNDRPGIGKRILEIGAIGGGLAAAKSLFGRKKTVQDDVSDAGPYRPPLDGNQSVMTDSVSRLEEGRPYRPVTPTGVVASGARPSHPLAQPPMTPGSAMSSVSSATYSYYDDYASASPSRRGRHQTFKEAVVAGGAMYAVRQLFKNRRQKKDEERAEALRQQRIEEERIARANSKHKYTGDGLSPPRRTRPTQLPSQTASDISSMTPTSAVRHEGGGFSSSAVPIAGGAGAAAAAALAERNRIRPVGQDPVIAPPGPASAAVADMPPIPPPHTSELASSGSELYTTASGRQRHRHHILPEAATAVGAAALGMTAADARRRRQDGQNTDSLESPPVSIHVKTQDNGRKVTLRRLTEEELAAQRAARRQERRTSRRRRNSSFSSADDAEVLNVGNGADQRWRRTERQEAEQQQAMDAGTPVPPIHSQSNLTPKYPTPPPPGTHQGIDPHTGATYDLPPPPPIPTSTSNLNAAGSVTSPGTETSGPSEYANNRKRRRAERAQARIAREARTGGSNTVDFT